MALLVVGTARNATHHSEFAEQPSSGCLLFDLYDNGGKAGNSFTWGGGFIPPRLHGLSIYARGRFTRTTTLPCRARHLDTNISEHEVIESDGRREYTATGCRIFSYLMFYILFALYHNGGKAGNSFTLGAGFIHLGCTNSAFMLRKVYKNSNFPLSRTPPHHKFVGARSN